MACTKQVGPNTRIVTFTTNHIRTCQVSLPKCIRHLRWPCSFTKANENSSLSDRAIIGKWEDWRGPLVTWVASWKCQHKNRCYNVSLRGTMGVSQGGARSCSTAILTTFYYWALFLPRTIPASTTNSVDTIVCVCVCHQDCDAVERKCPFSPRSQRPTKF